MTLEVSADAALTLPADRVRAIRSIMEIQAQRLAAVDTALPHASAPYIPTQTPAGDHGAGRGTIGAAVSDASEPTAATATVEPGTEANARANGSEDGDSVPPMAAAVERRQYVPPNPNWLREEEDVLEELRARDAEVGYPPR